MRKLRVTNKSGQCSQWSLTRACHAVNCKQNEKRNMHNELHFVIKKAHGIKSPSTYTMSSRIAQPPPQTERVRVPPKQPRKSKQCKNEKEKDISKATVNQVIIFPTQSVCSGLSSKQGGCSYLRSNNGSKTQSIRNHKTFEGTQSTATVVAPSFIPSPFPSPLLLLQSTQPMMESTSMGSSSIFVL